MNINSSDKWTHNVINRTRKENQGNNNTRIATNLQTA